MSPFPRHEGSVAGTALSPSAAITKRSVLRSVLVSPKKGSRTRESFGSRPFRRRRPKVSRHRLWETLEDCLPDRVFRGVCPCKGEPISIITPLSKQCTPVDGTTYAHASLQPCQHRTEVAAILGAESHLLPRPASPKGKKLYVAGHVPYPSGAGLHVGHPEGYTAPDIVCRYQRMRGKSFLHPMGWDAFGLPAEQHAIKTGTPPRVTTEQKYRHLPAAIEDVGLSYDWDRELSTTDVAYFRWTQWIFLQLYDTWFDGDQQKGRPIAELPIPAEVTPPQELTRSAGTRTNIGLAYQFGSTRELVSRIRNGAGQRRSHRRLERAG